MYLKKVVAFMLFVSFIFPLANIAANDIEPLKKSGNISIRKEIRENIVYIECVISNFSLSDEDKPTSGDGYIKVYIDGVKVMDMYKAAFKINGLPKGKHEIKIEVVNNAGKEIGVYEIVEVEI